ncbi:putative monooxygenase p33MONOX isoform X1 [Oryzias melastigma]|uniref:Putative monooxygenase p33MONOX n=1 Tax=Oryzias melastigma TaxID=30732 RepID=A0A3B3BFV9_ORYME|nr:putative monooxygenase p33MONOX isoform X1 [Oryzias melastigma]
MDPGPGDFPAIESGMPSGFCGALSPAVAIRHSIRYDEHMDTPMHSPPSDMTVNTLWKDPIIPRHRFRAEEGQKDKKTLTFEGFAPPKSPVPVVKAKATSFMSSLMTKKTQENLEMFEHQAGLTDDVYSPHKGLSTEETRFPRRADVTVPKLRMPSGDFKEDRLTTSAHPTTSGTPPVTPSVTPSVTPTVSPLSSPALHRRNWFHLSSTPFLALPDPDRHHPNADMGGNEGGGGGLDKWSFFGSRSVVHKSPTDPGSETSTGFSLQSYFGLQKSSTIDGTNSQITLKVDEPPNFMPPKPEIPGTDKRVPQRPHKLKPRDMNVLTPSGF